MTRTERAHAALYFALIGVLAVSGTLFVSRYFNLAYWEDFTAIYLGVLVLYTAYLFVLLLVHDVRPRVFPQYRGEKIAVMVPCFNEEPELVEASIRSVFAARGRKQVIVIDDGSTNDVRAVLHALAQELPFVLHVVLQNAGKREALHYATKRLLDDDVEFVVTIDSDTLLDEEAIVRVVEPLLRPRVGAATGNVLLLNERHDFTRFDRVFWR